MIVVERPTTWIPVTVEKVSNMKKMTFRRYVATGVALGAMTLGLAACSSGSSSSGTTTSSFGSTVTFAEAPQTPPNYIFPFESLAFFSVNNSSQFQYLMYRPLYWFGVGNTPSLNTSLSLASVPTYSNNNQTVTVNLKNYKWSNGESVTSRDVLFFMNMDHAEKSNFAAYSPGAMPDDVSSVTADSSTQVTFKLTGAVNPQWFTYNELSQITPFPVAWDITSTSGAPGSGACSNATYGSAAADTACAAVYTFLSEQAGYNPSNPNGTNNALATYATNPIWGVVDGPWKLTKFDSTGNVTMTANPSYSGPNKPSFQKFQEVPFTTETAEFNALVSGSIDVGYVPATQITSPAPSPYSVGPNNPRLASTYTLDPWNSFSINYFPLNFNSTGDDGNAGPIFRQLYFRQALQDLVNQPLYLKKLDKNYGAPTYGPVPVYPPNSFVSSQESANPYPYSPSKAIALLKSHGWNVVPNGTTTCTDPGSGANQCGAGIAQGAQLAFNLQYASGNDTLTEQMNAEKSAWALAGINITLSQASFNSVLGVAVACSSGPSCSWEMENWGGGWVYSPDYYPSGETIFQTGAGSNSGSYSDPTNDANITATNTTSVNLDKYQNYLSEQLPVVWQPNASYSLTEIKNGLSGVSPQNPLLTINPENWKG